MCSKDEKPEAAPMARSSLLALLAELEPLDKDFPPVVELPLDPVDL